MLLWWVWALLSLAFVCVACAGDAGRTPLGGAAVRITKALNRRTGATKTTKGKRARSIPIEPAVVALLEATKSGRGQAATLVENMPSERGMARGLRRYLWKAGVRRPELHKATPTTRPIATSWLYAVRRRSVTSGADGTRTRGLRRDRTLGPIAAAIRLHLHSTSRRT